MKRHETLIPLSRFHRSVLFLALVAKKNAPKVKGYPDTLEGKKEYAISFYKQSLKAHHLKIEEQLTPQIKGKNDELDLLSKEIIEEHQLLESLFNQLEKNSDIEESLHVLGVELEKHVRKVEREFFQKIQEVLSDDELKKMPVF